MSSFRKRPKGFIFIPQGSSLIREVVSESLSFNGTEVIKESVLLRSESEFLKNHPIPQESYSISEQLSAGVSLRDIPMSGMLDSSDNLDYSESETAEEEILNQLNKQDNNE